MALVCKDEPKQTTRLQEQWTLDWQNYCRKHGISIQTSHATVKHGSGGVVIGARFATTGPGHLAVIESNMNFYKKKLQEGFKNHTGLSLPKTLM